MLVLKSWVAGALALIGLPALGGVSLTADVYETPGMAGYWTYDLTVSADDGYLNGLSFYNGSVGGIRGPLHHGGDPGSPTYGWFDPVFGGSSGSKADSHWLLNESDVLSIGVGQSSSSLSTASVFWGTSAQRDTLRSMPFARLVTNDPAAVSLDGQLLVNQRWSDGSFGESVLHNVQMSLSDVLVGAPAALGAFPDRPLPPVLPEPPVYVPPTYEPPAYVPPTYDPPVFMPPVYDPPTYDPPVVVPPSVTPPGASRVVLSAEAIDTPGLPGYRTYTVTATAIDGYLNAFDFTNFAGGTNGISGPLHHGTPSLENLGADRLFASGPADPTDSQWLVSLDDGLAIGAEQSEGVLEAAYTFTGTGGQRDTFRSLPLAQLVTNDPSAVSLIGEFALSDAWSDGTVGESWQSHLVGVSATLSDLVGVTPPELGAFPDRPAPTQPPIVVTEPPVVTPPTEWPLVGGGSPCGRGCWVVDPTIDERYTIEVGSPTLIDPATGEPIEVVIDDARVILITDPTAGIDTGLILTLPGDTPTDWFQIDWDTLAVDSDGSYSLEFNGRAWPWIVEDSDYALEFSDADFSQRLYTNYAYEPGAVELLSAAADQSPVPEPGAGLLAGVGLLAVGSRRGRR